jgi:hypothetical protein
VRNSLLALVVFGILILGGWVLMVLIRLHF